MLLGQLQHFRERLQLLAAADDDGRRLLAEEPVQPLPAFVLREAGEEVDLRQTHDLQPQFIEIIVISGQEQARAVDFRDLNADVFQLLRRLIHHLHADLLRQLFERNGEIAHRFSSCIVSAPGGIFLRAGAGDPEPFFSLL